jgi:hypothetical protein
MPIYWFSVNVSPLGWNKLHHPQNSILYNEVHKTIHQENTIRHPATRRRITLTASYNSAHSIHVKRCYSSSNNNGNHVFNDTTNYELLYEQNSIGALSHEMELPHLESPSRTWCLRSHPSLLPPPLIFMQFWSFQPPGTKSHSCYKARAKQFSPLWLLVDVPPTIWQQSAQRSLVISGNLLCTISVNPPRPTSREFGIEFQNFPSWNLPASAIRRGRDQSKVIVLAAGSTLGGSSTESAWVGKRKGL